MKLRYTFACPLCRKRFSYDEPGEPCCTGPSEMRDDHDLTVMRLVSIERVEVPPVVAAKRAASGLLMPESAGMLTEAREVLRGR